MNYTIDASVFVSAVRLEEDHYTVSRKFLRQVQKGAMTMLCPTLVLAECAAAIARPTGDSALAEELIVLIENYPGLRLVSIDLPLARRAAQIATTYRLRGSDSIYVAVAEMFNATLITWDIEMQQRGSAVVQTLTPTEWNKRQGTAG